jgi:hypothetical protein
MVRLNTEDFIRKAKIIHGNKYDYSKTIYINGHTKLSIICPFHGEFSQRADSHLEGKTCFQCNIDYLTNLRKDSFEKFVKKAIKIHGNKYDYSKVKYIESRDYVCIICPIHGEFFQKPNNHLNGYGCRKCGIEKLVRKQSVSKKYRQYRWKNYTLPNGKVIRIQGYENWTIDKLLKEDILQDEIKTEYESKPTIDYEFSGSFHKYIPDCYIPSSNIIIETKSKWTWNKDLEQNLSKISSSLCKGYDVRVLVWDRYCRLVSDLIYRA